MTSNEIKVAVRDAVIEVFKDPEIHCRYNITADDHSAQHEALRRFISFTDKIDGIKWKSVQTLVIISVIWLFSIFIFGAYIKLKLTTWFGL